MATTELLHVNVADGVRLAVTAGGPVDGPLIVLLHGFPELSCSWRHQLAPLAAAGYRVLAPDLRGLGASTGPAHVEAYDNGAIRGDVLALIDAAGARRAALIGHDWGASFAWHCALAVPERVACVAGLSVPAMPRAPAPPVEILRARLGEDFYIVWFQRRGVADAALSADVRRTLATTKTWGPAWAAEPDDPPTPSYLTEEQLEVYVDAYTRTGFTAGLNWYRNIDRNWAADAAYAGRTIDTPALFITGARDPVRRFMPAEAMTGLVTDLRETMTVPGAGHWVQQEAPVEVNAALLRWLADVHPV